MSFLPLTHSVVYVLIDPVDWIVRYVGTSKNPNTRFKEHMRELDGDTEMKRWIKSLSDSGKSPIMVIVDTCVSEESIALEMEWIVHFSKMGHIFNIRKK